MSLLESQITRYCHTLWVCNHSFSIGQLRRHPDSQATVLYLLSLATRPAKAGRMKSPSTALFKQASRSQLFLTFFR